MTFLVVLFQPSGSVVSRLHDSNDMSSYESMLISIQARFDPDDVILESFGTNISTHFRCDFIHQVDEIIQRGKRAHLSRPHHRTFAHYCRKELTWISSAP